MMRTLAVTTLLLASLTVFLTPSAQAGDGVLCTSSDTLNPGSITCGTRTLCNRPYIQCGTGIPRVDYACAWSVFWADLDCGLA